MTLEENPFGNKVNPFSAKFRNVISDLANHVVELAKYIPDLPRMRAVALRDSDRNTYRAFPAILLNAQLYSDNRWKYSWVEYVPDLENGSGADGNPAPRIDETRGVLCRRSDTRGLAAGGDEFGLFAFNGAEYFNDGTAKYQSYGEFPESNTEHTSTLLPIGAFGELNSSSADISNKTMVMMYELPFPLKLHDDCRYMFFAGNGLKVDCV